MEIICANFTCPEDKIPARIVLRASTVWIAGLNLFVLFVSFVDSFNK